MGRTKQVGEEMKQKILSESISLGVSFHTLPRDDEDNKKASIRDCCIAPEGYDFITADYKAMELRVLAHISGDENMIKMFHSKVDPHIYTASLVYEKDVSRISKEERQIAKSGSFLIVYGGGAWKLSKTCNISIPAAERTIEKLKEVYPGVFIWMDKIKAQIYEEHKCKSLFGRIRNLPDIMSNVQKVKDKCIRQGVNFIIQHSASVITCYAVVDIYNELKFRQLNSSIVGSVHDSIEVVSSKQDTEETLQIMRNKMENYPLLRSLGYNFKVPICMDAEIGRSFSGGKKIEFSEKGSVLNYV